MKRILLVCLTLVSFLANQALAQDKTVTGTVISQEDGYGLPGVNVSLKGANKGTLTDIEGKYSISVPQEGAVLVFSFVGMASQEIAVGSKSVVDVELTTDTKQLSEVVITGMGVSREKRAIGYAVQEVKGESLAEAKETNIVNSLQGQVAGVQIQGTSGALGGSSRILIRGASSLTGQNQPLFVVDGVPINNSNYSTAAQQRGFGGGAYDYGNAASDINPEDIASMSVLKGASATAIYGTRGANGVILITTKKGKQGKGIGVSVNSSATFDSPLALIPHQKVYGGGSINPDTEHGFFEFTDTDGKSYLAPNYGKDGAWGPKYDPNRQVRHWDSFDPNDANYRETRPWVAPNSGYENFFETGKTFMNSVALSGGNDNGTFRLSYTNTDQAGILPNSGLNRNNVNLNATYKLSDKLTASAVGTYVVTNANGRTATGYSNNNPLQGFTQWWQTQLDFDRLKDYKYSDGSQQTWNRSAWNDNTPNYFDNPYWVRYENIQRDKRDRFFGNFGLNYKINDYFSVDGKVSSDSYSFRAVEAIAKGGVDVPYYSEVLRTFAEVNKQIALNYSQRFGEISVNAMVGGNQMYQKNTLNQVASTEGLDLDGFYNISNAISPNITTDFSERAINSIYGTASFGFRDMVFLDGAIRGDWSSTLPEENNFFYYPSVSTSFVFSELPSLNTSSVLSFGKLRMGYGVAGNDAPVYSLYNTYTPLTPVFEGNARYALPNTQNNPQLQPEFTHEFEAGVELQFLEGRVGIDAAYYNRRSFNQIFEVASSSTTGFDARFVNAGSMRNSGIEVMINTVPVKTKDFSWDLGLNFSRMRNEVEELADGVDNINMGSTWAAHLSIEDSLPYMALMGQDFIYDDNGNKVVGEDGMYKFTEDRVFLGSAMADFTGGIKNTFRYKGFTLGAMVDFQKGGIIHSTSLQWAHYSGMAPATAETRVVDGEEKNIREVGMILDGVKEDGTPNDIPVDPQLFYTSNYDKAALYTYKADFVKLREVRLGYTLPNKLFGKYVRDVNLSVIGRNLAILYSDLPFLDPQVVTGTGNRQGLENAQVPSTRSLGFNLSFKL